MNQIKIGIIGGSGLDNPSILDNAKDVEVDTPYGKPSSALKFGQINGVDVILIARHGTQHTIPPTHVNYRANIHALKAAGCTHIIATTAVGSLKENIKRGDLVIIDQFIDFTRRREVSFYDTFEPHAPKHTPMAEPFDKKLRKLLNESCSELGITHHEAGTVVTIEGSRFSTRAESKMFIAWGGDIINMSIAPEAILANELEIPYAAVAMSTDYDCWKEDEEPVTWEAVLKIFGENVDKVTKLLIQTIPKIEARSGDTTQMKIVLASQSPRRKILLERAGLNVTVDPSNIDERSIKEKDLKNLVLKISELKAKTVAKRHKDSIIIAADTMVYHNNKEIGQPKDRNDACKILKELLGKTHEVGTGITIINTMNGKMLQDFEVSFVTLKNVSDERIEKYLDTGIYVGKAGAYGLGDKEFSEFEEKCVGDRTNVSGLPIEKVKKMLKEIRT